MKKFILIFLIIFSTRLSAQQEMYRQIDQLLKESAAEDAFSGNVLIAKEGTVVYKNSTGFSNWEKKTPFNDSTLFNVGSIGKDFTQVVMIQLSLENKINFDSPLSDYLKLFPEEVGRKITLRMLLTMRSGLADYHDKPFQNLQERLDYIKTQPLLFEPGSSMEYSNSGYVVLAAVIEKVTGKSYEENVRERIFIPMKMTHSDFVFPESVIPNRAAGTEVKPNGVKATEHEINDDFTPSGDGGEYSTTSDLLKFYYSIFNDNILLNNKQREIFLSRFDEKRILTLEKLKENENSVLGYAGGLNGWNSCVNVHVGKGYIVVVLSNFSDTDQPAEELNKRITRIIRQGTYDAPRTPRFVFAYRKLSELGVKDFLKNVNEILRNNGYEEIQGPYFLNTIAQALYSEKKFDDAVNILSRNTELFPHAPLSWQWLGMAFEKAGKKAESQSAFKKCLLEDPENEMAKEHIH